MKWGNEASRGERASVLLGLDPGAEKILGQSKYGNIFYPNDQEGQEEGLTMGRRSQGQGLTVVVMLS